MDHSLPHGTADERRSEATPTVYIFDICGTIHRVAGDALAVPRPAARDSMPKPNELSPAVIRSWAT
jgi:hypothetical protein